MEKLHKSQGTYYFNKRITKTNKQIHFKICVGKGKQWKTNKSGTLLHTIQNTKSSLINETESHEFYPIGINKFL